MPRAVHNDAAFEATFWDYHVQDGVPAFDRDVLAGALFELHESLASSPERLPVWSDELGAVREVLVERGVPALGPRDRELLVTALDELLDEVARRAPPQRALHGSPHDGNVLVVDREPRFIDFETACAGPLEWDLAHVGADVVAAYPAVVDSELLNVCRGLVSVKTATWCCATSRRGGPSHGHNRALVAIRVEDELASSRPRRAARPRHRTMARGFRPLGVTPHDHTAPA
jgi:Phosphotransferase enzyme family